MALLTVTAMPPPLGEAAGPSMASREASTTSTTHTTSTASEARTPPRVEGSGPSSYSMTFAG